jgi:hypothetical protein
VNALDREATETALKGVLGELDYDLAKAIDRDEETGEDRWHEWVDKFESAYIEARGELVHERVLDLPLGENDSGANTVRGYLLRLLLVLWDEQDGFSGKRPFGNSGWDYDLYKPLIEAGLVDGKFDEDGYIEEVDGRAAKRLIEDSITALI